MIFRKSLVYRDGAGIKMDYDITERPRTCACGILYPLLNFLLRNVFTAAWPGGVYCIAKLYALQLTSVYIAVL